jgi:hypothetical protein
VRGTEVLANMNSLEKVSIMVHVPGFRPRDHSGRGKEGFPGLSCTQGTFDK